MKIVLLLILPLLLNAKDNPAGVFSGRISRVNFKADLLRVKYDFGNVKYLNAKDKVEFWDERDSQKRCKGFLVGKSHDYLLFKVPSLDFCKSQVFISVGAYLKFYSVDLENNLKMGKSLIEVLLKKRLALKGQLSREQRELDSYVEKVNAINSKFYILREKLEAQWRDNIGALEEDKLLNLQNYKDLERRLAELDKKLERYNIEDQNLKLDRWSLDSRLFFRK